jgi:hypothetical protein
VSYTCTSDATLYGGTAGTTYDTDANGATVETDANGSASFDSAYEVSTAGSVTCTSGEISGTGAISNGSAATAPGGTVTVSQGAADADCAGQIDSGEVTTGCYYINLVVTGFPADSIVYYGCTDVLDAGDATADTDSAGTVVVTDASGSASFDTSLSVLPSGFTSGSVPACTSDDIDATYEGGELCPFSPASRPPGGG